MIALLLALQLATGSECLRLDGVELRTNTGIAELNLLNACGQDAYAISVDVEWVFADGTTAVDELTVDTWASIAAWKAFGVEKSWFVAGAGRTQPRPWPKKHGSPHEVRVKTVAVELDGGRVLGDAGRLEDLLKAREKSIAAWRQWEKKLAGALKARRPLDAVLAALGKETVVGTPGDMAREELRRMVTGMQGAVKQGTFREHDVGTVLADCVTARAGR